ncbi:MAG: GtrA family protein [Lactobacillales bacterium]|jgi:putative flippase GtrA|nr:GtrA family protein [Lactobacillales bacterium]
MSKQQILTQKNKANEFIMYLIFGFLTTIVYFFIRLTVFALYDTASLSATIANIVAVIFAFITNKFWVFKNQNKGKSTLLQFFHFTIGRLVVFTIDVAIAYFAIDKFHEFFIHLFHLNNIDYTQFLLNNGLTQKTIGNPIALENFIFTIIGQIIAIITNYFISKFIVFKK